MDQPRFQNHHSRGYTADPSNGRPRELTGNDNAVSVYTTRNVDSGEDESVLEESMRSAFDQTNHTSPLPEYSGRSDHETT